MSLRVVFMGSPAIAVPSLQILLDSRHQVVGVVSQPNRPVGRGLEINSPPVAQLASAKGISLFQPEKIRDNAEFLNSLKALKPDVIIVVAYGKILPPEILDLPLHKCINVHFSLLPQYRGAAPVQWALMNSEEETGVTTMIMVEKLDAGPILLQKKVAIHEEDDASILSQRLAIAGARLLVETLDGLESDVVLAVNQNERLATYAPILKKEDGLIDWTRKNSTIHAQIRGLRPWPGTFTYMGDKRLKIHSAEMTELKKATKPGEIVSVNSEGIEIACGKDGLLVTQLQLDGGKKMSVAEFIGGHEVKVGTVLSNGGAGYGVD